MILTKNEILAETERGNIFISPFDRKFLQPNSYDFHLGEELIVYDNQEIIDEKNNNCFEKITIPEEGIVLEQNRLYLGITHEVTASTKYAQFLFGDNSLGSLGVWVHVSAPLAHVGSSIRWTLEIRAARKVRVYPRMKFGKICFVANKGAILPYGDNYFSSSGKYIENQLTISRLKAETHENTNWY